MKRLSRNQRIIIAGVIAIAIVIAGTAYKVSGKRVEVGFKEVTVSKANLQVNILSTGVVKPENRLEIKPPLAGRVETVLVKEGDVVKKGQVLAWMSTTERAALLDAARAKGPAELKHWEELYNPSPIIAPIHGTIIARNVEPGQTFTTSDPVLVMSDRLTIKAQVDETDISQIKDKQKAMVVLDAYANQKFAAHVDQIAYDAKTVNNVTTYTVDVLPDKTPDFLRSGMTANVTFFVASKDDVLLIPNDALKVKNDKFMVMLKDPGSKTPIERDIEVGLTDGKFTEVLSGLQEGDVLLVAQIKGSREKASSPFSPMGGGGGRKK